MHRYRFLFLLLLPVLWWAAAGPASAHDELISTTPSDGTSVTAPTTVRLTFSDTVIRTGTKVEVRNPSGQAVSGAVQVSGPVVSVALPASISAGSYTVVWRVTSEDGHPISGNFGFKAIAAASSSSSTAASPGSSAGSSTTRSDSLQKDTISASATPTQRVPTNATNNEPGWIIGAVAIVILAIAAGVWISRRRLTDDEPQDGPADDES